MRAVDHPYFASRFVALAHRGGFSGDAPLEVENSLRAFRGAAGLGYRYLETDVHATADGVLVAFHDDELDRVTDATGRVRDLPWDVVRSARIGGSEAIPRLDDLLEEFPAHRFNLDIKEQGAVAPLVASIERHAAHDRVCVGSFSTARIGAFRHAMGPRVATAASQVEVGVIAWGVGARRVWPLVGQALQVPERDPRTGLRVVSRGMVRAAHRRGAHVHVWTINASDDMERLIDLGVDGLVTDDIGTLKEVLISRGLWEGEP